MRHMYIRGIAGIVWLTAAAVSSVSGNFEMAVFYVILGGFFLYSAYGIWKKEKADKEGR